MFSKLFSDGDQTFNTYEMLVLQSFSTAVLTDKTEFLL